MCVRERKSERERERERENARAPAARATHCAQIMVVDAFLKRLVLLFNGSLYSESDFLRFGFLGSFERESEVNLLQARGAWRFLRCVMLSSLLRMHIHH